MQYVSLRHEGATKRSRKHAISALPNGEPSGRVVGVTRGWSLITTLPARPQFAGTSSQPDQAQQPASKFSTSSISVCPRVSRYDVLIRVRKNISTLGARRWRQCFGLHMWLGYAVPRPGSHQKSHVCTACMRAGDGGGLANDLPAVTLSRAFSLLSSANYPAPPRTGSGSELQVSSTVGASIPMSRS